MEWKGGQAVTLAPRHLKLVRKVHVCSTHSFGVGVPVVVMLLFDCWIGRLLILMLLIHSAVQMMINDVRAFLTQVVSDHCGRLVPGIGSPEPVNSGLTLVQRWKIVTT